MDRHAVVSDEELLDRLKNGSSSAFAQLFERYFEPLYRHAVHMLSDDTTAYDLVQDIFAALWEKRDGLAVQSVKAYLYAAIRNGVLNEIRRSGRQERHLDALAAFVPSHAAPADWPLRTKQLEAAINDAIDALPERMRQVYLLRRDEGLSHEEIAQRLGISKLTVKTHMNKALHLLWKRISMLFTLLIVLEHLKK